jgi:hypothetical protein
VTTQAHGARTVRVPASRLERWFGGFGARHGAFETAWDRDGLTLRGADGAQARLTLPYPPWPGGGVLEALEHLASPRRTLVLVVRRGGYACAVVEPDSQVTASKVGSRHVQGRTAAGGWSQPRFARRRDKQAAELVHAVADHAVRILVPALGPPAPQAHPSSSPACWLATGGDRPLVAEVLVDPRLRAVRDLPRATHLALGDPDRRLVQALPELLTTVTITITEPDRGATADRADDRAADEGLDG